VEKLVSNFKHGFFLVLPLIVPSWFYSGMNRSFIFIVVAFLAISARYAADAKKINRSRKRGRSPSPAPGAKLGDNGPFLDFMKSETERIIGTLPWSTVAEIRVFQAMPSREYAWLIGAAQGAFRA
jgi:hypothetical protein